MVCIDMSLRFCTQVVHTEQSALVVHTGQSGSVHLTLALVADMSGAHCTLCTQASLVVYTLDMLLRWTG